MKTNINSFLKVFVLAIVCGLSFACSDSDDKTSFKATNISGGRITVAANETFEIEFSIPANKEYYSVKFESTDTDIFTVGQYSGIVTGVSVGKAQLIVSGLTDENVYAKYDVVVTEGGPLQVQYMLMDKEAQKFIMYVPDVLDLPAYIAEHVTIYPENAPDKSLVYTVESDGGGAVSLDQATGKLTAVTGTAKDKNGKEQYTVVVKFAAVNGPSTACAFLTIAVSDDRLREYTPMDRTGWSVRTSHPVPDDLATVYGGAHRLIDDPTLLTCLSFVKPGKSINSGGVTYATPAGASAYFVIDMGAKRNFNYFYIQHRTDQTAATLRVWSADIWVSDTDVDGSYVKIATNVTFSKVAGQPTDQICELDNTYSGRYFKFEYKTWDTVTSTSMQTRDFQIGNFVIL